MGDDPGLERRVADGNPPRPGQGGRLDARRHGRRAREDVVGEAPDVTGLAGPEDRVPDEAIRLLGGEQAPELELRALGVEAPPRDRGKAGVPIPLPRIVAGAGTGVGEAGLVAGPCALEPVLTQRLLTERSDGV